MSGVEAQGVPGKPERLAPSHPLWLRCPGNLGWQEPGGLAQLTLSPCTGQPPRGRAPRPPRSDSRPSEAARARTAPRRGLGRAAAYTWNNGVASLTASFPPPLPGSPRAWDSGPRGGSGDTDLGRGPRPRAASLGGGTRFPYCVPGGGQSVTSAGERDVSRSPGASYQRPDTPARPRVPAR